MDNKIENFLNELNKIKISHPNLYNLWKNYLDNKVNVLNKTLDEGFKMLQYTKNIKDFTQQEILSLYHIKNHLK